MSEKEIQQRIKKMHGLMLRRFGPKFWKSGKRNGQLREPGMTVPFSAAELHSWVMAEVGIYASPCPFCGTPIDALSLSLDHDVPASRGGSLVLDNLVCCCLKCNKLKGSLTGDEFRGFMLYVRDLAPAAQSDILTRLNAGAMGMRLRYFGRKA